MSNSDGLCTGNMAMLLRQILSNFLIVGTFNPKLELLCYALFSCFLFFYAFVAQAFKLIVSDPDSVIDSLSREVKEIGPNGKEVNLYLNVVFWFTFLLPVMISAVQLFIWQVTKLVPAISEEVKDALVKNIRRRMTPHPLKIRADIEMKCFEFDGVLHIKVLLLPSLCLCFT